MYVCMYVCMYNYGSTYQQQTIPSFVDLISWNT